MSETSNLLCGLLQRARTFVLVAPVCAFSPVAIGPGSDAVDLAPYTFSASPASSSDLGERSVHVQRLTQELLITKRILSYLNDQCAPDYCHQFVAMLDAHFRRPDLDESAMDAPEFWSRMLVNARGVLLDAAPNAGEWYRLIEMIEPGANPPVPDRFIRTVELEPIACDWRALDGGLWAQDIARQFDGDC